MEAVGFCAKLTAASLFTSCWLSSCSFLKSFAVARSGRGPYIDFGEFITLRVKIFYTTKCNIYHKVIIIP
jgi:hypothetical protein